jgi:hypothetical protein
MARSNWAASSSVSVDTKMSKLTLGPKTQLIAKEQYVNIDALSRPFCGLESRRRVLAKRQLPPAGFRA